MRREEHGEGVREGGAWRGCEGKEEPVLQIGKNKSLLGRMSTGNIAVEL